MSVDLTLAVTAHDETVVAGPGMESAERACRMAEAEGFVVERMIALDDATPECREFFTQPAFSHWTVADLAERDLGHARNAIVRRAQGRWIAFLDADDLFSENWLAAGAHLLAAAEQAGERVIVHPELNWLFDGTNAIVVKVPQDDPGFRPSFFYFANYWDSLCLSPREAHLEIPYVPRDIPAGLSYQDWQFSIETAGAGWRHVIAPDTIVFKRRRDASLVTESRDRRSIVRSVEPMAIDRVRELGRAEWSFDPATAPRPHVERRHRTAAFVPPPATPDELAVGVFGAAWGMEPDPRLRTRKHARRPLVQLALWVARGRIQLARDYLAVRRSGLFDEEYYVDQYADVKKSSLDALAHYLVHGAHEGRSPNPDIDIAAYLEEHPNLRVSGANPLLHWLEHRGAETNGLAAAPEKTAIGSGSRS